MWEFLVLVLGSYRPYCPSVPTWTSTSTRRHLPLISFNFFANLPLIRLEKGETKRGLPQISTQKDYATSLGDYAYHSTFHEPSLRFSRLAVPKKGGFDYCHLTPI